MTFNRLRVTDKHGHELEILFRKLMDPLPFGWKAGWHWAVEAYEAGLEQPPIGFCWVYAAGRQMLAARRRYTPAPLVEYVRVCHTYERNGVATALLDAARKRWPNLELTPAATPHGEAFLAAYLAHAEQDGDDGREFVRRFREYEVRY